jgi:hypothetical protein
MFRGLILIAALLACTAGTAFAQSTSVAPAASRDAASQEPGEKRTRLMLGVDLKETTMLGSDAANKFGIGFMWRWRSRTPREDDHWALAYRLGSYGSRVSSPILGESFEMGPARFRPLMVGAEYKMPRGKWTWSAGATAGWSLNSLDTSAIFHQRLAEALSNGDVGTDIHNSFAWSPRVKGWYDVNRRVSFMVEAYYAHNRPELTIRSGALERSYRLNADAWVMKTGLVYGVW